MNAAVTLDHFDSEQASRDQAENILQRSFPADPRRKAKFVEARIGPWRTGKDCLIEKFPRLAELVGFQRSQGRGTFEAGQVIRIGAEVRLHITRDFTALLADDRFKVPAWGLEMPKVEGKNEEWYVSYAVDRFQRKSASPAGITEQEEEIVSKMWDHLDYAKYYASQVEPTYLRGRLLSPTKVLINWREECDVPKRLAGQLEPCVVGEDFEAHFTFDEHGKIIDVKKARPLLGNERITEERVDEALLYARPLSERTVEPDDD